MREMMTIAIFMWGITSIAFAGKIYVSVSVDWEGRSISNKDIKAMKLVREAHPDVPMIQFLNAAYYTKKSANPDKITNQIRSVLLPNDEHGLHIHGWKTLFEASGVSYRPIPSVKQSAEIKCNYDCGHTVVIEAYKQSEIEKVIVKSLSILEENGFQKPKSFRAGAWMAGPNVLGALISQGFQYDSSAVVWNDVAKVYGHFELFENWVTKLWPDIHTTSQPYLMKINNGSLWQMPDNGCLADYMTIQDMLGVFNKNVKLWEQDKSKDVYIHFGFHQETAFKFAWRINRVIQHIKENKLELPIEFVTFKDLSES